jgi:hypothetical protein
MVISKDQVGRWKAESAPSSSDPLPYRVIAFPPPTSTAVPPPTNDNADSESDEDDDVPLTRYKLDGRFFPFCPTPTYSLVPHDSRQGNGHYGLPSNLDQHKGTWRKLWDEETWNKCVHGDLCAQAIMWERARARKRCKESGGTKEEMAEAEEEAEETIQQARRDVLWWILSVTRPLWVVHSGVSAGSMKTGGLYINRVLAEKIWGKERGEALAEFLTKAEEYHSRFAKRNSFPDGYS